MATLGGSAPTLSDDYKRMGPPRIITASEIENRTKAYWKAFRIRSEERLTRGKLTITVWFKFGWKLEDLFRFLLGLKAIDGDTRYFWLLRKRVEGNMRQFVDARARLAEYIFRELYLPTAGQDQ